MKYLIISYLFSFSIILFNKANCIDFCIDWCSGEYYEYQQVCYNKCYYKCITRED